MRRLLLLLTVQLALASCSATNRATGAARPAGGAPIFLQALSPTSGTGAASVLDAGAGEGWTPAGDPRDEGILFRFAEPTAIDSIRLTPCAGAVLSIILSVDGAEVSSAKVREGGAVLAMPGGGSAMRSAFVRITGGHGCLAGVAFSRGGVKLPVRPPRTDREATAAAPGAAPGGAKLAGELLDRQWIQACFGGVTRHLKLRANGTFSWYEAREEGEDRGSEDVYGGTYVVRPQEGPWARVELQGRRHRSERTWRPREAAAGEEAERSFEGSVEIARLADLGPERWKALFTEWNAGGAAAARRLGCVEDAAAAYPQLVARGAIVLRGAPFQDLLVAAE